MTLPVKMRSDFDFAHHAENDLSGPLARLLINGGDEDFAVLLNVNLRSGFRRDFLDGLSAGADNLADAFGIDLNRENRGGILRQGARGAY